MARFNSANVCKKMTWLLLGASFLAISATAQAQTAPTPAPAAAQDTTATDSDGEIVVTAQYRSQSLQDVPVSISAINADQLRLTGANTLKDLQYAVPNVTFAGESFAGNPKVVIRGLYINTRTTGLEPSFGVYVDGVFQGRPIAYNLDLADVERIEYLRGPQGSLYGKNTISGAVNVITQKPGDHLEGTVSAEYGNYNYYKLAGTIRGPISDTLGFKVTGFRVARDPFFRNIGTGGDDYGREDRWGGSGELRYNPNSDLELILRADGLVENRGIYLGEASNVPLGGPGPSNGGPVQAYGAGISSQYAAAFNPAVISQPYLMDVDAPSSERRRIYGFSGTVNYRLGDYTLTSITAFRHASDEWAADDDYGPFDFSRVLGALGSFNQTTQEFRLTSPDTDRFNYVIGAFYLGSDVYQDRRERTGDRSQVLTPAQTAFLAGRPYGTPAAVNRLTGAPLLTLLDYYNALQINDRYEQYAQANIASYALYGQFNFKVTDWLTLIGGLRYSIETKIATYQQNSFTGGVATQATGSTTTPGGNYFGNGGRYIPLLQTPRYTDRKLTPTATVEFKVTDDINLFARYASGFKGTGFNFGNGVANGPGLTTPNVVRGTANSISLLPENVDSYEAGVKSQFFGRALTVNATYFYQRGENLQISALLPDLTRPAFNTNARVQGFEIETTVKPLKGLQFGANIGYTDVLCVGGGAAVGFGGSPFNLTCTKGVRLENVSKWNISGNVSLKQPINDDLTFVGYLNAFHRTSFLGGTYLVDGYSKVDARVGLELSNGLSFFVWGQNIFNKVSIGNSFGNSVRGGNPPVGAYDFIETFDQPRTFGGTIEFRF